MPVVSGGDMFLPTPDPGQDQQPAQGQLGQMMPGSTAAPMQPPQSPEEHAQNKAGWLDWLRNPSTSAFLMQFGASMLQPNPRGFGAQLGQSVGEAGQAVARVGEQERATEEEQAKAAESRAQAGYYEAETKAKPTLTEAQLIRAQAASDIATSKMDTASQLMWYKQRLDEAISTKDYANAQLYQAQIEKLQQQTQNPGRAMYEKEHEAWVAGGELGPEPKPTDPAYQFGTPTAPGTAPSTTTPAKPTPEKPLPMPSQDPAFLDQVLHMSPDEIEAATANYRRQGPEALAAWDKTLATVREHARTQGGISFAPTVKPATVPKTTFRGMAVPGASQ